MNRLSALEDENAALRKQIVGMRKESSLLRGTLYGVRDLIDRCEAGSFREMEELTASTEIDGQLPQNMVDEEKKDTL